MNFTTLDYERDKKLIHDILYNCGSKVSKRSYGFFSVLWHFSRDKCFGEFLDDFGFYFVSRSAKHWRLIELAVDGRKHARGYGKALLTRLLAAMKANGVYKLTFRTPMDESAQHFWLHMGAQIVDVKDNDYVMEINLLKDNS